MRAQPKKWFIFASVFFAVVICGGLLIASSVVFLLLSDDLSTTSTLPTSSTQRALPLEKEFNGRVVWSFDIANQLVTPFTPDDNTVYIGAIERDQNWIFTSYIYAINSNNGAVRWQRAIDGIISKPIVSQTSILYGNEAKLYSLDREGQHHELILEKENANWNTLLIVEGTAYFSISSYNTNDKYLIAVNLHTKQEIWRIPSTGLIISEPSISSDFLSFGDKERFYLVKIDTGEVLWTLDTQYAAWISPLFSDGIIFFQDTAENQGNLYAVDQDTGKLIWSTVVGGNQIPSTPVLSNNVLFSVGIVNGKARLYAIDVFTGEIIWSFEANGDIATSPSVVGKNVLFGAGTTVYSVDIETGVEKQRFKTKSEMAFSAIDANNTVYFSTMNTSTATDMGSLLSTVYAIK